jgi:hypothetical protein
MLVDTFDMSEGPFSDAQLVSSDEPGKPWVIAEDGRPNIFRVVHQEGQTMTLERPLSGGGSEEYTLEIRPVRLEDGRWVDA